MLDGNDFAGAGAAASGFCLSGRALTDSALACMVEDARKGTRDRAE